jgi:hypothetical protein
MAWKEVSVDKQKKLFMQAYLENQFSIAILCGIK